MTKITEELITQLSNEAHPIKPIKTPAFWTGCLFFVLIIYAIILQMNIGLRSDIAVQFVRPLFAIEIVLMVVLCLASNVAAVLTIYPDFYQKSFLVKIPYLIFVIILCFFISQLFMENDPLMLMPNAQSHKVECLIFVAIASIVPAVLIFIILCRGATISPFYAGSLTVLSSSSLGYLILRLQEPNDLISHILVWHYLPIIIFAALGVVIGRSFLKW